MSRLNPETGKREYLITRGKMNMHGKIMPIVNDKFAKIGRNELCLCGSGKKFKKCHL